MKCSYCGTEFQGDSCSYCGAPAAASQPQPEPEPSTPQGQPIPPDVQPPVQTPQAQPPAGQQQKPAGCGGCLTVIILISFFAVILMGANLIGILFSRFSSDRGKNSGVTAESTTTTGAAESSRITLEKYGRLENGMSYAQALEILGCEPSFTAETGEEGTAGHMRACTWSNPDGGVVSLMFRQDKLYTKSQAGLT